MGQISCIFLHFHPMVKKKASQKWVRSNAGWKLERDPGRCNLGQFQQFSPSYALQLCYRLGVFFVLHFMCHQGPQGILVPQTSRRVGNGPSKNSIFM